MTIETEMIKKNLAAGGEKRNRKHRTICYAQSGYGGYIRIIFGIRNNVEKFDKKL